MFFCARTAVDVLGHEGFGMGEECKGLEGKPTRQPSEHSPPRPDAFSEGATQTSREPALSRAEAGAAQVAVDGQKTGPRQAAGRARLQALEKDAAAKGFLLIAHKAATAVQQQP